MSDQEPAKDLALISDGYHTFAELYEHRHALFIALCFELQDAADEFGYESDVWRSRLHSDGTMFDGWFVMGINRDRGRQITYHLPERLWSKTEFAPTRDSAPSLLPIAPPARAATREPGRRYKSRQLGRRSSNQTPGCATNSMHRSRHRSSCALTAPVRRRRAHQPHG